MAASAALLEEARRVLKRSSVRTRGGQTPGSPWNNIRNDGGSNKKRGTKRADGDRGLRPIEIENYSDPEMHQQYTPDNDHQVQDRDHLAQDPDHWTQGVFGQRGGEDVPASVARYWRTLRYLNLPTNFYKSAANAELSFFDGPAPNANVDMTEGTPYLSVATSNSPSPDRREKKRPLPTNARARAFTRMKLRQIIL